MYEFLTHNVILVWSLIGLIVGVGVILFLVYEFVTFIINFMQWVAQNNNQRNNPENEESSQ